MPKIVKPSVVLEWVTPGALGVIEAAGRVCWQSEGEDAGFIPRLIKRGHESVLEHASVSFRIRCDRGISHELVRHRLASYSQESTRYVKYATGIEVIVPSEIAKGDPRVYGAWWTGVCAAEAAYRELITSISPSGARSVLPTCLKTEIVMTANMREWRHFLKLRTAKGAHADMRVVAGLILEWFRAELPVLVEDILPC